MRYNENIKFKYMINNYQYFSENVQVEKSCQLANRPYTFYAQDGCPSILIGDLNITSGMSRSDPRCQNISQKVQKIVRHCRESEEPCEFILTNLTTEKMCFQLHKTIIIEYLCTGNEYFFSVINYKILFHILTSEPFIPDYIVCIFLIAEFHIITYIQFI